MLTPVVTFYLLRDWDTLVARFASASGVSAPPAGGAGSVSGTMLWASPLMMAPSDLGVKLRGVRRPPTSSKRSA